MSDMKLEIGFKEDFERELKLLRTDILDAMSHVGAKAETKWIGFAFTVTYVLLGLILWRVW